MIILSIKLRDVDYQLKNPIEINEEVLYLRGKQMFIFSNTDFNILSCHDDKFISERVMQEEINLMIESYLFEPNYVFSTSKKAMKLKRKIMEHVYG